MFLFFVISDCTFIQNKNYLVIFNLILSQYIRSTSLAGYNSSYGGTQKGY
jgi:hypothetical protein